MMKIRNTNPAFGDLGPFEVDSIDDLVSEMLPLFRQWALEEAQFDVMTLEVEPIDKYVDTSIEIDNIIREYVNIKVAESIEEFKAGLEVIK